MHRRIRGALLLAVIAAVALVVAACGSSNKPKKSTAPASGSPTTSSTSSGSKPGAGKPPIVLGDKNFPEEYILGALYQQALEAKGYKVTLKGNIGSSELIYKALKSGQIQAYPEYTGTLDTAIAGDTTAFHSAQAAYAAGQQFLQKHGYTFMAMAPFSDSDAIGTTAKYASAHHLKSIGDLAPLGKSVTMGGLPEFQTRAQALVGLKKAYHINPTFVPITSGLFYNALNSGQVDTSDVFTTDPPLKSKKYVVLSDPKHVFGFQNEALIVKKSLLTSEGPAFARTVNAVTKLLTIPAIIAMNGAVEVDKQSPASVAHTFLADNHLL
jgi:osmoprotectant transport system substrate-binding protein